MTNEEYSKELQPRLNKLKEQRAEACKIAASIIAGDITDETFYFGSAVDKCIRLIDGLIPMLQARNLTCAGILLRAQMDNCMRTYAPFIAEDKCAILHSVIDGSPIKKMKDTSGKCMADWYLREKVNEIDKQFSQVYEKACGFVHFSDKAFYQTVSSLENNSIGLGIGIPLPEKRNTTLLECADAYIHFIDLNFHMLQAVADSKRKYEESQCKEPQNIQEV